MGRPRKYGVTPYVSGGYWNMRQWVDGKLITAKVKDPDGSTKGEAEVKRRFEAALAAHTEAKIEAAKAAALAAALPPKPTSRYTVHSWVRYYVTEIVFPSRAYNTWKDYQHVAESMIIPNIEDVPLPDLDAEHIEKMIAALRTTGSEDKPYRAYDRLRTMLNAAVRRQKSTGLTHNPAKGVESPPTRPKFEIEPPTRDEVKRILAAAQELPRNGARWTIALALGLRQGEALALKWDDVDLDRGILRVRTNTYRRTWQHGCDDPHACGQPYHRYPCPGSGAKHNRYHRDGCPKVPRYCAPDCTRHAAQCPQGHGGIDAKGDVHPGGRVDKDPKSSAGVRVIKMPKPVVAELRAHKAAQDKERLSAGDRWQKGVRRRPAHRAQQGNLVFANRMGTEINERDDWGEFADLVEAAEVTPKLGRKTRPHDGRHFAATMLLLLKIEPAVVMDVMGWSSRAMLDRYQHVIDEMRAEAAEAVTGALWADTPDGFATPGATVKITDLDEERRKRR